MYLYICLYIYANDLVVCLGLLFFSFLYVDFILLCMRVLK